jgi:hypothetical protein
VTTIEAARKARDEARAKLAQKITEISNYFTEISNYRTVGGPCPIETEQLDAYEAAIKDLALAEFAPFLILVRNMDNRSGHGAGGQMLTEFHCRACGGGEVAGDSASSKMLCRACRAKLRVIIAGRAGNDT